MTIYQEANTADCVPDSHKLNGNRSRETLLEASALLKDLFILRSPVLVQSLQTVTQSARRICGEVVAVDVRKRALT